MSKTLIIIILLFGRCETSKHMKCFLERAKCASAGAEESYVWSQLLSHFSKSSRALDVVSLNINQTILSNIISHLLLITNDGAAFPLRTWLRNVTETKGWLGRPSTTISPPWTEHPTDPRLPSRRRAGAGRAVIFAAFNCHTVSTYMRVLHSTGFVLDPLSFHLVIFLSNEYKCEALETLWRMFGIYQSMAIKVPVQACTIEKILIYDPFVNINNTWSGEFSEVSVGRLSEVLASLGKRLQNMRGYPVPVFLQPHGYTVFERSLKPLNRKGNVLSRDMQIMYTLEKKMNFTKVDGSLCSGEIWPGQKSMCRKIYENIYFECAEIGLLSCALEIETVGFLSHTLSVVDFVNYVVIVPKAPFTPKWTTVFRCFQWPVWVTLIISYTLCSSAFYIVRKISDNADVCSKSFYFMLNTFLGLNWIKVSWKLNLGQNILIILPLLCVAVVLINSFQSIMCTLATHPIRLQQITTYEDLARTSIPIYVNSIGKMSVLVPNGDPLWDILISRVVRINMHVHKIIEITAIQKNVAFVYDRFSFKLLSYQFPEWFKEMHVISSAAKTDYATYTTRKGSPYRDPLNTIISRLVESGLRDWWYHSSLEDFVKLTTIESNMSVQTSGGFIENYEGDNLGMPLMILLFGIGCSCLVFFTEIIGKMKEFCNRIRHLRECCRQWHSMTKLKG